MKREWGKYTEENIAFGELKSALETALGRELREDEAKSVKWLAGAGWDTVGRFVDMFKEITEQVERYENALKDIEEESTDIYALRKARKYTSFKGDVTMKREKSVDELLDELGWGWLPTTIFACFFILYCVVGWLE